MIEIIILTAKIIFILFFMGAGFTAIFLPKSLRVDSFWLMPWFGMILIAVMGVLFSLGKVSIVYAKNIMFLIAGAMFVYALITKKKIFYLDKSVYVLGGLTLISLLYNLYPLISQVGFPTTVSLGNLDPLSYTPVADFLTNHTIFEGFIFEHYKPFLWATGDLLHNSFRWGSPMILSFIASVFNVRAYSVYFIFLTLSFVLSFPLVYIIAKRMIRASEYIVMFLIFITFLFNSTILYMIYNVFFAQFLFSGIYILIFLLLYEYLKNIDFKKNLNLYDLLLGILISSITTIYPEGLTFTLVPLGLVTLIYTIKNKTNQYFFILIKILFISYIINPYSFGTALARNLSVILSATKTGFIGWENIPYASPLEIMGLYNLYYSKDFPPVIDSITGIPIIIIWLIGLKKLKSQTVMSAFFYTFVILYIGFRFISPNFFLYHRAITYSLFLYPILFASGLVYIFGYLRKYVVVFIIVVITLLVGRSAYRTTYQMYWHMRVVDKALVSLQDLNLRTGIPQPFYTSDVFLGEYDLWRRLWREYFLMNKLIVTRQNFPTEILTLPKDRFVLAEKDVLEYQDKKITFKNIVWENEYYQLGQIEDASYANDLEKLFLK